jgi:hypothetical protein
MQAWNDGLWIVEESVQLLATGSYTDAVSLFQSALGFFRGYFSITTSDTKILKTSLDYGFKFEMIACHRDPAPSLAEAFRPKDITGFAIFNKAFRILGTDKYDHSCSVKTKSNHQRAIATVLYDMGLGHHLLSLRDTTDRQKNLNRALSLYQLALETVQKIAVPICDCDNFISMACLNNMGNIFALTSDVEGIYSSLEVLRQLLSAFNCHDIETEDDILHFQMSVTVQEAMLVSEYRGDLNNKNLIGEGKDSLVLDAKRSSRTLHRQRDLLCNSSHHSERSLCSAVSSLGMGSEASRWPPRATKSCFPSLDTALLTGSPIKAEGDAIPKQPTRRPSICRPSGLA